MGQRWSIEEGATEAGSKQVQHIAKLQFSEIEKYSVKQHDLGSEESLTASLQLPDNEPRATSVLFRSARFLASYPDGPSHSMAEIGSNIEVVIGFYDGRLRKALAMSDDEWRRVLFLSIASTATESSSEGQNTHAMIDDVNEFYIVYDDLVQLWTLLVASMDKESRHGVHLQDFGKWETSSKQVAERLLKKVKSPALSYENWCALLKVYPTILDCLGIIWDQLLFHKTTTLDSDDFLKPPDLPKDIVAELYFSIGPQFLHQSLPLFNARKHGFSMRAFEVAVTKWRSPTVLIVRGKVIPRRRTSFSGSSSTSEIDIYVPPAYDIPVLENAGSNVSVAIYVQSQWRVSSKKCFAEAASTRLIMLAPVYDVFEPLADATSVFFTPSVGIGAGFAPPQNRHAPTRMGAGAQLYLDTAFEQGVFRYVHHPQSSLLPNASSSYELRFNVRDVDVIGLGTQRELEAARKAWEWEDHEANRRQGVNIQEDRALLEMAGLVGQYTDRS